MSQTKKHHMTSSGKPTYVPLIVILSIILFVVAGLQWHTGAFDVMQAMRHFMGLFFVTFGAFKLIDWKGFVDMYADYDILAKRFRSWGFLYPLIEIALGLAYLTNTWLFETNIATVILMTIGSIGVFQALANRRKIHCACLGAVVKLPMSTVTLIEDVGMGLMALAMLLLR